MAQGDRHGPFYGPHTEPDWDPASPKVWDEWTDVLGHTYRAGDAVAVAVINGKSPQMVMGRVVKINRVDSQKNLILRKTGTWIPASEGEVGAMPSRYNLPKEGLHRFEHWYYDSCKVVVQPFLDARGFGRGWGGKPPKPVTYSIWQNILKVDATQYETKIAAEMAALADDLAELKDELA